MADSDDIIPTLTPQAVTDFDDSDLLQQADGQVSASSDGEAVILHLDTSDYFGADPVGSSIWAKLENQISFADLVRALTVEFEVDEGTCRSDIVEFLTVLIERDLLIITKQD